MKASEVNFREAFHQVCYISNGINFKSIAKFLPQSEKSTGVIAYCYIDHQAGLSFEILACAKRKRSGDLIIFNGIDNASLKYRLGSISDCEIYYLNDNNINLQFADKIKMIDEEYKASKGVQSTRGLGALDDSRSPGYPDDVMVFLFYGDDKLEGCWVRCEMFEEGVVKGILLNEPNSDFKVHKGDLIEFGVADLDDKIMCVAILG